jgi:uncharacterized protein YegL
MKTNETTNIKNDNNVTELVFILDRSGSMGGLETDTIGGFNAMIGKQKKETGKCFVTTILFDNVSETLYDRVDLSEIPTMTDKDYTVRGCTALLDAVGGAIKHIETIHKYVRPEDVPAHTMFIITTDGYENASHAFTSDQVKKMIEAKKELGWEFLFLGANIDAVETAATIGISRERAVNYHADSTGTEKVYACMSAPISAMRKGKSIDADWKEDVEADYEARKPGEKRRFGKR